MRRHSVNSSNHLEIGGYFFGLPTHGRPRSLGRPRPSNNDINGNLRRRILHVSAVMTARLLIVNRPSVVGVKLKLHEVVPVAALKGAPPFTDTSTRATAPPPVSLAVPVMLTAVPVDISAPALGDVIVEVGGVVSRITVTVIWVVGFCTFPLVSTARLMIVACPGVVGVNAKLHEVVPVAALKVAPPSTDTSTRATDPPPVSLAVPVMVSATPLIRSLPLLGK